MGTGNRLVFDRRVMRHRLGEVFLALFLALAPSSVPDWRADPGFRTVAVLPVGEPMISFDRPHRR